MPCDAVLRGHEVLPPRRPIGGASNGHLLAEALRSRLTQVRLQRSHYLRCWRRASWQPEAAPAFDVSERLDRYPEGQSEHLDEREGGQLAYQAGDNVLKHGLRGQPSPRETSDPLGGQLRP